MEKVWILKNFFKILSQRNSNPIIQHVSSIAYCHKNNLPKKNILFYFISAKLCQMLAKIIENRVKIVKFSQNLNLDNSL